MIAVQMPAVYLAKNLTYHQLNLSISTLLDFYI